ncbi:energy-coupling factor transporter transmembrane component T family protein [Saccharospirillum salsuginis]|uniref:Cobalt ABC transporter n=1 Tax=Saccharospirillum salsuginis TaxID=418750 RepID=A0A918NEF3_9GAMM|nr:energy-coupling factor transporter transmembrane component T [Saccharospirillum salsuginis]GGX66554.1 cobalt ABC transporter [Saccharospirillum salsuginis]
MISLYVQRQTWLHRMPAGAKLIGLAAVSVALYPVTTAWWLLPVLIAVAGAYASLGPGGLARLWIVKPLVPMFVLIVGLQWWTQSLNAALVLLQRMLIVIWLANLVTLTTRMEAMMEAVMPLLTPLKWFRVDPARVAFAVALLVRFVPVLMAVMLNLLEAWKARGGGRQVWRLAIPMMINAIRMSDHVSEALAARGGVHSR